MLIKSTLLSVMSGRVGGVVGSRNSTGQYLRAASVPVNPNTARQQAVRTALSNAAARWRDTLTAAQRLAWAVYAASFGWINRIGDTIALTGQQAYIASATARDQGALAAVDEGPGPLGLPEFTSPIVALGPSSTGAAVTFTSADGWHASGGGMNLAFSPPQPPSVNVYFGPYQHAGTITGLQNSPQTIQNPHGNGGPEGHRTFAQVRVCMPDGRISQTRQVICPSVDA